MLNFPTSEFQWGWPNSRCRLGSTAGVVATGDGGREPHGPLDHALLLGHCPCMTSTGSSLSNFSPAGLTFSDLHPLESHGTPSWELFCTDTHSLADLVRQTHSGYIWCAVSQVEPCLPELLQELSLPPWPSPKFPSLTEVLQCSF